MFLAVIVTITSSHISCLIDVKNSQKVSELSTCQLFHGSKPYSRVPSVLRVTFSIFICALVLVLWVRCFRTIPCPFFQPLNYPRDLGDGFIMRLMMYFDLLYEYFIMILMLPAFLFLVGGGIAGVVYGLGAFELPSLMCFRKGAKWRAMSPLPST